MCALFVTDEVRRAIAAARRYAEANPLATETVVAIADGTQVVDDSNLRRSCTLYENLQCLYTVAELPNSDMMQHLRVVQLRPADYPTIETMNALMTLFGFSGHVSSETVIAQRESPGQPPSVSVAELYTRRH